jgi:hypothetical protein
MAREELIRAMTTSVLEAVSPDETILAATYSPSHRQDGEAAKGPRGFGAETAIVLLLPYVYRFFEKLVDRVAQQSGDSLHELIKRWLQKPTAADPALVAMVEAELCAAGLDKEQAAKAAPSVLKTIASHGNKLVGAS